MIRLAPEHKFPASIEDSVAGLNHLLSNATELGLDKNRVYVMGKGAGMYCGFGWTPHSILYRRFIKVPLNSRAIC